MFANESAPLTKPGVPLADQAAMESFRRTGLTTSQKIIIVVISVLVLGSLIGGGIWLYIELDPFQEIPSVTPVNNTNNTNNSNSSIPLQELDTDKDGLRDIDEKRYGTDPLKADTDGDGFTDKEEIDNGYNPNGPGRLVK
ncbi:MAG: hypothetical protein WCV88_00420 [Patescibacteria group bacterium]|jgi:hypothetical protein